MTQNMGKTDRIIRVVLGILIIAAGFYFNTLWGALGLILLATGAIGWCPLYMPFHFSTKGPQGTTPQSS